MQISAVHAQWFSSCRRINKFSSQKSHLFMFCLCLSSRSRNLGSPKIGTHDAIINSHVESKARLSRFYRLLVMNKSILICQNSRTKYRYYALTRSPNYLLLLYSTLVFVHFNSFVDIRSPSLNVAKSYQNNQVTSIKKL